jgi:hypothetical protein
VYASEGNLTPEQMRQRLAARTPRKNVKKWGEIDNGKAIVRGSCRRCGTSGTFEDKDEQRVFEDYHNGAETNGKCPVEKDVKY